MISGKSQEAVVATLGIDERDSGGRDSRTRRDVGTLRLSGRGSLKVSRQVLAHVPSHLQHVDARNREDGLQLRIRLDGATLVERVLLDVNPDLLRHLGTRHGLAPQMAAKASLSFFGAKMPTPFFFMASAFFLPAAFFAALSVALVAFVIVAFFVVVVVVVMVIEGCK